MLLNILLPVGEYAKDLAQSEIGIPTKLGQNCKKFFG
jgi:hypothetical protein